MREKETDGHQERKPGIDGQITTVMCVTFVGSFPT